MAKMAKDIPVRWLACSGFVNDILCVRLKSEPDFASNRV